MITPIVAAIGVALIFAAALVSMPVASERPRTAPAWAPAMLYAGLAMFFLGWAVLPMFGTR